jgi:hypothetical protein
MDVDATRGMQEYFCFMRGKCFGCGSKDHTKKDGHHERDLCPYCKRVGHKETVCQDRFVGKPRKQKAAATVGSGEEGSNTDIEMAEEASNDSEKGESVSATRTLLVELARQQKELAKKIDGLSNEDF